jgi:hypothetical protein
MTDASPSPENVLRSPLTPKQIVEQRTNGGYVTGLVLLDTADMIDGDLESVLDTLSERLVGSSLGMDIAYEAVAVQEGTLVMRVTLDPSMVLEVG